MILPWALYVSFIGAAVVSLLPRRAAGAAKTIALLSTLTGLGLSVTAVAQYDRASGIAELVQARWVPSLGISYHLAADGISLTLVLLTGIAAVAGVLFSWNIEHRAKEYFAFYLALIGGVYGVFLSFDLFLLFVFYELAIIPKYFLIAIWGSTNKE